MTSLSEIRSKYPEYADVPDDELAGALHQKFYADIPREDFNRRIGLLPAPAASQPYGRDVQGEFDALPWYQKAATAVSDIGRMGLDGASFGYMDKAAARLNSWTGGKDYEAELAKERQQTTDAKRRAGWAGTVAEIGGGAGTAIGAASKGLTAMRAVPEAMAGIRGVLARAGAGAVDGAAMGAASAMGHDEEIAPNAVMGAAGGAAGTTIGDLIVKGAQGVGRALRKTPDVPTNEGLRDAAAAAFAKADQSGVIIKPEATQRLTSEIQTELANFGYHPGLQPRIGVVLNELERVSAEPMTFKGLQVVRRIANNARLSADPSERSLGGMIISKIDDMGASLGKGDVLTGDAAAASSATAEGRNLWSRMRKSETIDNAVSKADLRASSTGSGSNGENATRQNLRSIIDSPKKSSGFSADEKAAMEGIVRGTPLQNEMRWFGKLAPTGIVSMAGSGGLGALLGAASGGSSIAGAAALPMIGMAARGTSERMTSKQVEALSRLVRAGSRDAAEGAPTALELLAQAKRLRLMHGLGGAGAVSPRAVNP